MSLDSVGSNSGRSNRSSHHSPRHRPAPLALEFDATANATTGEGHRREVVNDTGLDSLDSLGSSHDIFGDSESDSGSDSDDDLRAQLSFFRDEGDEERAQAADSHAADVRRSRDERSAFYAGAEDTAAAAAEDCPSPLPSFNIDRLVSGEEGRADDVMAIQRQDRVKKGGWTPSPKGSRFSPKNGSPPRRRRASIGLLKPGMQAWTEGPIGPEASPISSRRRTSSERQHRQDNEDGLPYDEDPGVAAARAFFRKSVKAKKAKKMKAGSPKHSKRMHGVEGFALVRQTSVDRRREYFNEHVLNKISASGQHSMAAFLRHLMPTSPTSVRLHDEEDLSALDERIGRLGEEMVEFPPGEDGARWFFRKLVREKKANTIVPDSPKKAARTIRTQHGNEGFALVKARSPMARNSRTSPMGKLVKETFW